MPPHTGVFEYPWNRQWLGSQANVTYCNIYSCCYCHLSCYCYCFSIFFLNSLSSLYCKWLYPRDNQCMWLLCHWQWLCIHVISVLTVSLPSSSLMVTVISIMPSVSLCAHALIVTSSVSLTVTVSPFSCLQCHWQRLLCPFPLCHVFSVIDSDFVTMSPLLPSASLTETLWPCHLSTAFSVTDSDRVIFLLPLASLTDTCVTCRLRSCHQDTAGVPDRQTDRRT